MEVMEPLLASESGKILHELIENQLRGVEKFYELRVTEMNEMPLIGETGFDLITDKYRAIVRIFNKFPGDPERSVYNMLVLSDLYYILKYHTREWVGPKSD